MRRPAHGHWRSRSISRPAPGHVGAPIYGVAFGDGAYGRAISRWTSTSAAAKWSRPRPALHRIQVISDGGVIMDFPCSYGEADQPRNVTRSGIHVVTEKYPTSTCPTRRPAIPTSTSAGPCGISNNGEFIHANPASSGAQGNTNVTNGCINLSDADAQQYYYSAIYGDPVEVTGTSIALSYADGDIWDWTLSWSEWTAMSALSGTQAPRHWSHRPRRPMRRRCRGLRPPPRRHRRPRRRLPGLPGLLEPGG